MKMLKIILCLLLIIGCNPVETELPAKSKSTSSQFSGSAKYRAFTIDQNPVAQIGKSRVFAGMSMTQFLSKTYTSISSSVDVLDGDCSIVYATIRSSISASQEKCFSIFKTDGSQSDFSDGIFNFSPSEDKFYEVNTYVLANRTFNLYKNIISKVSSLFHRQTSLTNPASFPFLFDPMIDYESDAEVYSAKNLKVTALCDFKDNGYFDPVQFEVCLGYLSNFNGVLMAQDPSIVYHELGHLFVDIFINARNRKMPVKVTLGNLAYDEAGALNEAIADYYAYAITGRKHVGEWGLGFLKADRPLTESDSLHTAAIQASNLRYPDHINYNVYDVNNPYEAIHYTGQIASHFFTAFDSMLTSSCSMSASDARVTTLSLIAESLANIGDLTARDTDFNDSSFSDEYLELEDGQLGDPYAFVNNLNPENAYLFSMVVNAPNYRRFFQVFSRNVLHNILTYQCYGKIDKDQYEQLLDKYGLLLFKSYDDNLNGLTADGEEFDITGLEAISEIITEARGEFELEVLNLVSEINRQQTVLISKDQISLPLTTDKKRPQAYVFDKRTDVEKVLSNMTYQGKAINLTSGVAGVEYNNNNGYISPGEVVGVALNLVNNSNSIAAGVEILANDWDHLKKVEDESGTEIKPCQFKGWPLESENGAVDSDPAEPQPGDCEYISRDNGTGEEPTDIAAPICLIQKRTNNETKWVTQVEFAEGLSMLPWRCLNHEKYTTNTLVDESGEECAEEDSENCEVKTTYEDNPECMIRVLESSQHAFLSYLKPQKTLLESLARTDGSSVSLNASSAIFFEVSKYVPPGTTFMCRFRVRMNNCSDCFEDEETSDNYLNHELNGYKPYKLINYKFTVID